MPITNQEIGATSPKSGTYQYTADRIAGLKLVIPAASSAYQSTVTNRRIVSIQQYTDGSLVAAIARTAISGSYIIVGWGVLEEALQSGGLASISPTPNSFVDGDIVTVLRNPLDVYMIDTDGSNTPTNGINTAYLDSEGRITSVSGSSNLALQGSVFTGVPGPQLSSQLATDCVYYQLYTSLKP